MKNCVLPTLLFHLLVFGVSADFSNELSCAAQDHLILSQNYHSASINIISQLPIRVASDAFHSYFLPAPTPFIRVVIKSNCLGNSTTFTSFANNVTITVT